MDTKVFFDYLALHPPEFGGFCLPHLGRCGLWFRAIALSGVCVTTFGGCDSAPQEAELPGPKAGAPKYASPWDRPIGASKTPAPSGSNGPAPRVATLSELLNQSGIAAAGGMRVETPSPWEIPEGSRQTKSQPADTAPSQTMPSERYWSVALASFPRDTQAAAAVQMLEQVRAAGLTQAYVEERGRAIVIAFGKYDSPGDAQARRDLERIKHTKVGETEPFAFAVLSPPAFEPTQGSMPQFELRNSREQYGKGILYTLQIGVYWRADGQRPTAKDTAEYRAAAEKAAVQLRREGEEAFYYHGPLRSMVTVGVFSERDYDMKDLSKQSPRLLRLREKFPYNLENGAAIKRKRPGQAEAHFDPSFVVTVPD